MIKRASICLLFHGTWMRVRFDIIPPDREVGILGASSEGHTLHNRVTEARLTEFETKMTDADWEELAEQVDNTFDFNTALYGGMK